MKKEHFSSEKLKELREILPWGAQTKIAETLTTPEKPITPQLVSKVLHNIPIRLGLCDPMTIIMEASRLASEVKTSRESTEKAVDEVLGATIRQ